MGRHDKAHADGIKRKQESFASVVNKGFDQFQEDQAHALKAEEELRPYWVDRCLGERAAARQMREAAAVPLAPPAAAAAPLAPPAAALHPPADAAAPDPPADEEFQAPPAE